MKNVDVTATIIIEEGYLFHLDDGNVSDPHHKDLSDHNEAKCLPIHSQLSGHDVNPIDQSSVNRQNLSHLIISYSVQVEKQRCLQQHIE